mgnify:FL=1
MGGLSCVAGKPEDTEQPEETRATCAKYAGGRRESQLPWNRRSLQVYAGDPKKKEETKEDKPPDESEPSSDKVVDEPPESEKVNDKTEDLPNGVVFVLDAEADVDVKAEPKEKKEPVVEDSVQSEDVSESSVKEESAESELNDSVPEISTDPPSKFYYTPIKDISYKNQTVIKRPRSLESADYLGRRSRPMSYSPAMLKTKHPRSLHCITAAVDAIRTPPMSRPRPQSMDFSGIFDKDFDFSAQTQKLKRMLTSPKKQKHKKAASYGGVDNILHVSQIS